MSKRAERAVGRADAKRRKATVLEVTDDGEFIYVEWIRDNGEKVHGHFKLEGWGRAPEAVTRRTLEALARGPVQILYPRRANPAPKPPPNVAEAPKQ